MESFIPNGYWVVEVDEQFFFNSCNNKIVVSIPVKDIFQKECTRYVENGFIFGKYAIIIHQIINENLFYVSIKYQGEKVERHIKKVSRIDEKTYQINTKILDRRALLKENYRGKNLNKKIKFKYRFDDEHLDLLREMTKMEDWMDDSSEINKIKSILFWIGREFIHDGSVLVPKYISGTDLIQYATQNDRKLNCRGLSVLMSELCLAAKLFARFVVCIQKESSANDCHVVCVVYEKSANKWIMFDPSYSAWLLDEDKQILSLEEIRWRIAENKLLRINDEAQCGGRKLCKELYLRSLTRKLYRFISPQIMSGHSDNGNLQEYVQLVPDVHIYQKEKEEKISSPNVFWEKP